MSGRQVSNDHSDRSEGCARYLDLHLEIHVNLPVFHRENYTEDYIMAEDTKLTRTLTNVT